MVKHTLHCEGVNIGRFLKHVWPFFKLLKFSEKRFSIQIYFFRFYFQTPSFLNEFACAYVAEKYDATGATKCNFLVE